MESIKATTPTPTTIIVKPLGKLQALPTSYYKTEQGQNAHKKS